MVDLYPALQAVKTIMDSLKAISTMRDDNLRIEAVLGVNRQLIQLQGDLMKANETQAMLTEKVRSLEAELAGAKTLRGDLERYELKNIGGGASAYMLKPEARGAEPPHWLCPTCYSQGKKSIYQFSVRAGHIGSVYRCAPCEGHVTTREQPRWV